MISLQIYIHIHNLLKSTYFYTNDEKKNIQYFIVVLNCAMKLDFSEYKQDRKKKQIQM